MSIILDMNGNPLPHYNYSDLVTYMRQFQENVTVTTAQYCRTLISNSIGKLPLVLYKGEGHDRQEVPKSQYPIQIRSLSNRPNDFQTWQEYIRCQILNVLDQGDAFGIALRNPRGNVATLVPVLNPKSVSLAVKMGMVKYQISMDVTLGIQSAEYTAKDIQHMRALTACGLRGESIISQNISAFKLYGKAEAHGLAHFENAASPTGVFTTPKGMTSQQHNDLSAGLSAMTSGSHNASKVLVLPQEVDFKSVQNDHSKSQYIESREYQRREILAAYGVPQGMIDGKADYKTAQLAFYKDTIVPYCRAFLDSLNRIVPDGYSFEFDSEMILAGDPLDQVQYVQNAIKAAVMTPNEGRVYLGRDPVEGGDVFAIETNNISLGSFNEIAERQRQQKHETTEG